MRAVIFDGSLQVADVERPVPGDGEALVRVSLAGICGTDLEILRGYKGFCGVLGHEFVGTVEQCGDQEWPGRRVCGEINVGCGACDRCAQGVPGHCAQRTVVGILNRPGAFAEYIVLPTANLHVVPDSVDDESAVFVEPLAAAFRVLEQVNAGPSDRICVLGDGKLGILCARVLATTGGSVTLVGKHAGKLRLAAGHGVRTQQLGDSGGANDFDVVVEATGNPGAFATAMALTRPLGTLVLKSTAAHSAPLDLSPTVVKEVTVVGSRCGPFATALHALEHGHIQVRDLICARYPLEGAVEAFRQAGSPEALKVLLET